MQLSHYRYRRCYLLLSFSILHHGSWIATVLMASSYIFYHKLSVSYITDRGLQHNDLGCGPAKGKHFQYPTSRIVDCNSIGQSSLAIGRTLFQYPTSRIVDCNAVRCIATCIPNLFFQYPTSRIVDCNRGAPAARAPMIALSVSYITDRGLQHFPTVR